MEGLWLVLLFFGVQRLVVAVMIPITGSLISKTGYRWMMLLGLMALALKSWLLMQVGVDRLWLLIPALILGGIAIAGYYLGYHGIFLDDNDDQRIGEQMGLITMAGRMALIVSPLLAGWLIDSYGFGSMFATAMVLPLISMLPLLLMPRHERHQGSYATVKVLRLLKKKPRFTRAVWWWHFENALQTFYWPVFLFLVLGSHIRFGLVGSLVMMVNSLAVYLMGKVYDRRPLRRGYPLGAAMVMISWWWRFVSPTPMMVVGADGFNRLVSPLWWMKIRRQALIVGEKVDSLVFAAAWEFLVTGGYLAGLILGFELLIISGGQWLWLAAPAALGVWASARAASKND
jgi:MFS family permease